MAAKNAINLTTSLRVKVQLSFSTGGKSVFMLKAITECIAFRTGKVKNILLKALLSTSI